MGVHMAIFLLSVVSALYSKQTSPPQILEANHKYTVPVKGPPQMRKNLWHCISERNPLQRNFRSHMAEAHARDYQEEYARQNSNVVSIVLVLPPSRSAKIIRRNE